MLKALFLDLDETLCDTLSANEQAKQLMGQALEVQYGAELDGQGVGPCLCHRYLSRMERQPTRALSANYQSTK